MAENGFTEKYRKKIRYAYQNPYRKVPFLRYENLQFKKSDQNKSKFRDKFRNLF